MRRLTAAAAAALLAAAPAALPARAGDAGEGLFLRGEGAEVLLAGGRLRRPATDFACAGCHGADGRGRREGGTVFPPILWSVLTDPARPGGPYGEAALARALETGIAPDGRSLGAAMPRFALADPGLTPALARYLAELDSRQRRGITADRIALSPPGDPVAAGAFAAALEAENRAGGVWGRRFSLAPGEASLATADDAAAALAPAIDRALAGLAAEALRTAGEHLVSLGEDAARLRPALAAHGVTVAEDAGARLASTTGGLRLTLPEGAVLEVAPAATPDEDAGSPALPAEAAAAALVGHEIARAALACGRGMTRACLLEALGAADLSGRYAIRAAATAPSGD